MDGDQAEALTALAEWAEELHFAAIGVGWTTSFLRPDTPEAELTPALADIAGAIHCLAQTPEPTLAQELDRIADELDSAVARHTHGS